MHGNDMIIAFQTFLPLDFQLFFLKTQAHSIPEGFGTYVNTWFNKVILPVPSETGVSACGLCIMSWWGRDCYYPSEPFTANQRCFFRLTWRPLPVSGLFGGHLTGNLRLRDAKLAGPAAWYLTAWRHNGRHMFPSTCSMKPYYLICDVCIVLVRNCAPERRTVLLEYTLIYSNMQEYVQNVPPILP